MAVVLIAALLTAAQVGRQNTWTAKSRTGQTYAGTYTVQPAQKGDGAVGTWTLVGAQGRTVARGTWSAAKSPDGWSGTWRARLDGGRGEYSGTWNARVDLKGDARFADLFQKAADAIVSGGWKSGGQSGGWSIRAGGTETQRK